MIKIKRVYEKPEKSDGERILVDRVWPRGLTKAKVKADLWLKDLGPSATLRKWFGHDPKKWNEFRKRYEKELKNKKDMLDSIKIRSKRNVVTLVYGAKDTEHNQAVVLMDFLKKM